MSNEEQNNSVENQAKVDRSKRKFSKAGLVAPVIMTLASKPVFAVQGLSNMISGNTSDCRGDVYYGGKSHGYWKKPKDENGSFNACEVATNHLYKKYLTVANPTKEDIMAAIMKVTMRDAFGVHDLPGASQLDDSLIETVRIDGSVECQIVSGYLNLFYYLNSYSSTGRAYFLTEDQFWALNDGDTSKWSVPEGYDDFADLIEKNMDGHPGNICNADGSFK